MELVRLAPHFRLRPIDVADARFVVDVRRNELRSRFIHAIDDDVAAQAEWIRQSREQTARMAGFYWVIESFVPDSPAPVGLIRLSDITPDSFVLGSWVMAPEAPVTASIEGYFAACDFGFGQLGCRRYFAAIQLGNKRMLAFHERVRSTPLREEAGYRHLELQRERYLEFRRRYRRYTLTDDLPPPLPQGPSHND